MVTGWARRGCELRNLPRLEIVLRSPPQHTSEITMPIALPSANPYMETTQFIIRCAYDRCLDLEKRHAEVPKHGRLDVLVCARMLGYVLLEAPTEEGRMEFASEVIRCSHDGDKELQSLAELYKDHLLRVCKSPTYKRVCSALPTSNSLQPQGTHSHLKPPPFRPILRSQEGAVCKPSTSHAIEPCQIQTTGKL